MKNLEFQDYDIVCFMQDSFSSIAAAEAAARFHDIQFRVYENTGIEEAIAYVRSSHHAKVICVDCSNLDLMISQIEPLMEYCPPDTNILIVGNKNDVGIFRDLMRLQVSDYLVKPLNPDFIQRAFFNAMGLTAQDKQDRTKRHGKIILFLSTVGGAGSTTVATNTAHMLANGMGKKVVLVDGDLTFGNISRLLDIKPSHALFEMLESPDRLDEVLLEQSLVNYGDRLKVIASEEPLSDQSILDPALMANNFNDLLDILCIRFHYVILDMPRQNHVLWRQLHLRSDVVFIVTPLTFTGLKESIRISGTLKEDRPESTPRFILNNVSPSPTMKISEFEENLARTINVTIPYDSHAMACADSGSLLVDGSVKFKDAIGTLIDAISTSAVTPKKEGFVQRIVNTIKR